MSLSLISNNSIHSMINSVCLPVTFRDGKYDITYKRSCDSDKWLVKFPYKLSKKRPRDCEESISYPVPNNSKQLTIMSTHSLHQALPSQPNCNLAAVQYYMGGDI